MAKQLLPGKFPTTEEISKVVSDVRRGMNDWIMLDSCCGHRSIAIRAAIEQGLIIEVGDKFQAAELPPLPIVTTSATATKTYTAPILPGCKCRNADSPNPEYWLFTGNEADIRLAASYLNELGIFAWPQENGINGKYKLLVPNWVTGNLTNYYEDLEEGENYVVYSVATAA